MVSYTDSPQGQSEGNNNLLQSSAADNSGLGSKITKDRNPITSVNTPPEEPASPSRVSDKRYNHKIRHRPSKLAPVIVLPTPAAELRGADVAAFETRVKKLVENLESTSLETVREATSELRLLAKDMDNRILIASCGAIKPLVSLLKSPDLITQENSVTALLNLSISNNNKITITEAEAIEPLIHVLQTGTHEARENSAATLYSLSILEENKVKIGKSGAIPPLVELLGCGTPQGKKDAATALFNLSTCTENRLEIVGSGAVKHLVDLMDPSTGLVDRAVVVLGNLASIPEGRTAIAQARGVPLLVETIELGSAKGKEIATATLVHMCSNSNRYCRMVLDEGAVPPLVALSKTGTPRAKEKATTLLGLLRNLQRTQPRRV